MNRKPYEDKRFSVVLSPKELDRLRRFAFKRREPLAKSVRFLIEKGIKAESGRK